MQALWIKIMKKHSKITAQASVLVLVLTVGWVQGCKRESTDQKLITAEAGSELLATAPHNGTGGQVARCERIYHNNPWYSCASLRTPSCSGLPQISCMGSRNALGVKDASILVLRRVLEKRSVRSEVAQRIVRVTRQLLMNMMRDPQRPIHPAAFFATIKDYETGANLFEWGQDHFRCRAPGKCARKCVLHKDCERWCDRHGLVMRSGEGCVQQCLGSREGTFCDDRCYGLFQVDPEIDNFRQRDDLDDRLDAGSSKPRLNYLLWEEKNMHGESNIRWDMQQVCGADGLDVLGLVGGPDFCALLYWFAQKEEGRKCEALIEGQPQHPPYINPCSDADYAWGIHTFASGHRAYGQHQVREDAWPRKYQGFSSVSGKPVFGYEHCAADGYGGYQYSAAEDLEIPSAALRESVLEFGCAVGIVPPWAQEEDCVSL